MFEVKTNKKEIIKKLKEIGMDQQEDRKGPLKQEKKALEGKIENTGEYAPIPVEVFKRFSWKNDIDFEKRK